MHDAVAPTWSPRLAVVGGARAKAETLIQAESLGRCIAEAGAILICGGRGGVMEAACRGARQAGGLTVGILPGKEPGEANPWVELPIVTGLGEARNVIIARTADALIAVEGGVGTLSEIAFALKFERPVVSLGGWEGDPRIHTAREAAEAVRKALDQLPKGPERDLG